ncbi:ethanolamine utilization acetate kinase EutQ [Thauera linaloolentis]|nr:ethanolamine utilization acetate kinase EutQ [Thauera linaloolentis]MCM8564753.1 ethanolamine utilization acetate kinase EutQ [Thauera linaloolentis]
MKQLISADVVRSEHAAGKRDIVVTRNGHIVTPEARTVAEGLGILIREGAGEHKEGGAKHCGAPPTPAMPAAAAALPAEALAHIRKAVLAQLPEDAVSADVVDQLVNKVAREQLARQAATAAVNAPPKPAVLPAAPPAAEPAAAAEPQPYESRTIAGGIKVVKGDSVRMGLFDGAGEDSHVGIADLITSADGSSMAAGFMSWNRCFFPWTLNYDEVDLVLEGELHIRCNGQTAIGKVGDVIFIPKGSNIEFGTPSEVRFLYVAYPANWADC